MIDRRTLLKCVGVGATVATMRLARAAHPAPDLAVRLTAEPGAAVIRPGPRTPVLRFDAAVLDGDPRAVQGLSSKTYLGPVLRFTQGQRVHIRFENRTGEPSIVHWHGLRVPAAMDGHPRTVVPSGSTYDYAFEVRNRAATYWYHPHPHGRTGAQIYAGLAS